MATTIENITETATEKTQAHFADLNGRAKDAMEKTTKLFGEMNGFTKDNVEALVESGKLAIAGMQSMVQDQAAFVRKQFEEASAAARTLTTVKSPTEFVKMQGDFARQHFDGLVAEASRSTGSSRRPDPGTGPPPRRRTGPRNSVPRRPGAAKGAAVFGSPPLFVSRAR